MWGGYPRLAPYALARELDRLEPGSGKKPGKPEGKSRI